MTFDEYISIASEIHESLIVRHMTGGDGLLTGATGMIAETPAEFAAVKAVGSGWLAGNPAVFDRAHAIDVLQLFRFLEETQPDAFKRLGISDYRDLKDIKRLKFLGRLTAEIGKHGVIHILRKGLKHESCDFTLFFGTPSPGNTTAATLHAKNRFTVTRQLRYSLDETRRALDLGLFHPRRDRPRGQQDLRHHHRRSPLQPGRQDHRRHE